MTTVRLTAAQACVRFLAKQYIDLDGQEVPYFAGVWAIFGHGNVAGLGEALIDVQDSLPTYRAHNEQAMAHAAIAYAKQMRRRRAMVCTSSIGPGATNMFTAAALGLGGLLFQSLGNNASDNDSPSVSPEQSDSANTFAMTSSSGGSSSHSG